MNYFQGLRPATDKESSGSIRFAGRGAGRRAAKYGPINENEVAARYFGRE
jgi:hypothetical protein